MESLTTLGLDKDDTLDGKFLTFRIGKEIYGIEIGVITEIISMSAITEIPELPDYIKGVVNMRGKIVPVIDVAIRFNLQEKEYDERTCIIVIEWNKMLVGLIVERVEEVMNIDDENVVSPQAESEHEFVRGIAKTPDGIKLLLDCGRLLSDNDADLIYEE